MKYRIQKGIPLPPQTRRGGVGRWGTVYPWEDMEPGDSFFVPVESEIRAATMRVGMAARAYRKRAKKPARFAVRGVRVGNIKGVRCWRIE